VIIRNIEEASRLQNHLLPPGDRPLAPNGAPDIWQVTRDPRIVVERQRHLNHLQDDRQAGPMTNGDVRTAALRDYVRQLEIELTAAEGRTTKGTP
jgi:hypothetical protein